MISYVNYFYHHRVERNTNKVTRNEVDVTSTVGYI